MCWGVLISYFSDNGPANTSGGPLWERGPTRAWDTERGDALKGPQRSLAPRPANACQALPRVFVSCPWYCHSGSISNLINYRKASEAQALSLFQTSEALLGGSQCFQNKSKQHFVDVSKDARRMRFWPRNGQKALGCPMGLQEVSATLPGFSEGMIWIGSMEVLCAISLTIRLFIMALNPQMS